MNESITYSRTLASIEWAQLKSDLHADSFDNGRTPEQLLTSFENSACFVFAWCDGRVVGTARVLSDGVCNAYLIDVWTQSAYRNRGIAREMIRLLTKELRGQHIYLQADEENLAFYSKIGFKPQPHGLSKVVGDWLDGSDAQP